MSFIFTKMATRVRKRLSTKENKIIKYDNLELKDVICSICQSILVEPVTLPCHHYFCHRCFSGSVENNALCCPLCRLRIGSWLRTATKQNNLVNNQLWDCIRTKFPNEIDTKLKGGDVYLEVTEKPVLRLSAPGEIRSEYEMELKRLRDERIRLEQKQLQETELLIKKLQLEEAEAQKRYLEMLKQDEMLAKQMQKEHINKFTPKVVKTTLSTNGYGKPRLKPTKIDGYLAKRQVPVTISSGSPIITDDNTSTSESSPSIPNFNSRASPEMVPNYNKILKTIINKKINNSIVHKDDNNDGEPMSKKCDQGPSLSHRTQQCKDETIFQTSNMQNETVYKEKQTSSKEKETIAFLPPLRKSLPVSLPLPQSRIPQNKPLDNDLKKLIPLGVIQQRSILEYKNKQTFITSKKLSPEKVVPKDTVVIEESKNAISSEANGNFDEKDYPEQSVALVDDKKTVSFGVESKPCNKTSPVSEQYQKGDAPDRRMDTDSVDSMLQELCYFKPIESLSSESMGHSSSMQVVRVTCQRAGGDLGDLSGPLAPPSREQYLDGLCRLRHLSLINNVSSAFVIAIDILKVSKDVEICVNNKRGKRNVAPDKQAESMKKIALSKNTKPPQTNGTSTPCRRRTRSMGSIAKDDITPKKAKIKVRQFISERKTFLRSDTKKINNLCSSVTKTVDVNKIRSATKNLNTPLDNCDVNTIFQQIRIQKMIEKQDMDLALKVDAELNGRRQLRRLPEPTAVKRKVAPNNAMRPAKKLKV